MQENEKVVIDLAELAEEAKVRALRVQKHLERKHNHGESGEAPLDWAPDLATALRRASDEAKPVLVQFGVSALSLPASGFS